MAHIAKYTRAQCGHLFNHYNRDKEAPTERANKNIDPERTQENYNLMERDKTPQEYFEERLGQLYHIDRKDINVMCDWVITLPKDYDGKPEDFFRETTQFLNDRYGADNCIGAFVHNDETTPHMHYCFIPVVPDRNEKHEQDYKVNAKKVVSRTELQRFHTDLENHLRDRMPNKTINLQRTAEERKNAPAKRGMEEFKAFKSQEYIDKLKEETHRKEIDLKARQKDLQAQKEKVQGEQERYNKYFKAVEDYKAKNDISDREYFMSCYRASQGLGQYPAPERYNPDRELKQQEIESPERTQERDFFRDR